LSSLNYQERIDLFFDLFKGRRDVYPIRWENYKTGMSGYSFVCENEWKKPICIKAKGQKCKDCNSRQNAKFTKEVAEKHLLGQLTAGIYPLLEDNTTYFLAIDFDKKGWQKESLSFIEVCKKYDIPAYLEQSRSGNGGHVWIFFSDKYPAVKSRIIAFALLEEIGIISSLSKEQSFDRIFPNQDSLSLNGYGNLIALPLQGKARQAGNSLFLDSEKWKPYENQWDFLKKIKKIEPSFLDALLEKVQKNNFIENVSSKTLQIFKSKQLFLKKTQLKAKLIDFIKTELNIPNPEYYTKKRLGKSVYKVPQYFCAIKEDQKNIMLPRGFLKKLTEFCIKNQIEYKIENEQAKFETITFQSKITPYPYQENALREAEKSPEGVILAPPGAGKTIIGLQIIAEKKHPAIILVHRKQIFEQWLDRIEAFLKIPRKQIGQICSTKKKMGKKITVAMLQSLKTIDDQELSKIGTVIVDECHHIPANTFRGVITRFNPQFLYGLTATAQRKHSDEKLIFAYLGDIISELELSYNSKQTHSPKINLVKTNFTLPFDIKSENLQTVLKTMIFDTQRNELIVNKILENAQKGKILVITERKEHAELLNLYLQAKMETLVFTGDLSQRQRKIKFDQIKAGNFDVLLTTGQIFGEGVDISNLDILFLVFPFSFEGKLIQYIGRIQRSKNAEKRVFDFRDNQVDYFEKMFKKRQKYYNKINANKQLQIEI